MSLRESCLVDEEAKDKPAWSLWRVRARRRRKYTFGPEGPASPDSSRRPTDLVQPTFKVPPGGVEVADLRKSTAQPIRFGHRFE